MTKKVVVAMSGGVDSSVAAALLVEQGYDVTGIMMRLWSEPADEEMGAPRDNRCCTRDQLLDAHQIAQRLDIPFKVVNAQDVFQKQVVERFIAGYEAGGTPNPCLSCNRHIRFTYLLNIALDLGADYLATGHYARVTQSSNGRFELRRGKDANKDQSYVLSVLRQDQLRHAMFPVGGYTKEEVREMAAERGLIVANKDESQDLCFLADGDYRRFLRNFGGMSITPGPITLRDGTALGEHEGLYNYTIGQRKGLGISYSEPLYVLEKDASNNTLIVGTRDELGRDTFGVSGINWLRPPAGGFTCEVKIRYKAGLAEAWVEPLEGSRATVRVSEPLRDITPGQGAVFYDADQVVGSGIISAN